MHAPNHVTAAAGHTHLVGLLGQTWFQLDNERDQPGQELETRDGEVSVVSSSSSSSHLPSSPSTLNSLLPSCCVVVVWTGWWGGSSSTGYTGLSETHIILWQCIVGKQPGRGRSWGQRTTVWESHPSHVLGHYVHITDNNWSELCVTLKTSQQYCHNIDIEVFNQIYHFLPHFLIFSLLECLDCFCQTSVTHILYIWFTKITFCGLEQYLVLYTFIMSAERIKL